MKEWYLDTSELEQSKAELDFDRKATRADEVYRLRFAFPVLLGMVVLTVTYFLPLTSTLGMIGVDVGGAIGVICLVWTGVRFWQWRRLARLVAAVRREQAARQPQRSDGMS